MSSVCFADFINGDDIGMIKCRSGLGFADKTAHSSFVFGKLRRQNLQSDFAVKFRILRQINLAHSARADVGDDAVVRQSGIGC